MNIFHRFTRRSLSANRSRTWVTIIGIVLSMAMFTAVIEGAYSGQQFLVRSIEELQGRWLIYESGLNAQQADALRSTEGVAESAVWQELGWAEIGSENEYKPYLLVEAADEHIENLLSFRLLSGRMPENSNELLLPAHLASNGNVLYHEGDTLTLALGRRVDANGETLPAALSFDLDGGEHLTDTVDRSFTVVGTYERLDILVENYSCPGYTALTRGDGRGDFTVFLRLRHPSQILQWMDAHPGVGERVTHEDLRRFNGVFNTESYNILLFGFAGVLVFLISFGSISLIYNSFSISVSERTRQFGILKSVGATKKQIRRSVLYEALLLSAVGIPIGLIVGCVGIGLTLYFLRDAFTGFIFTGANTQMRLVLHPLALLLAASVCLVTTLISAAIPARRAIRISPIDSIRQSDDVKLTSREVRTSRLTQKLFGFEGTMAAKNFKRNRRRYRSTVVSLFLSVSLFISASSFCAYLTDAVSGATGVDSNSADISYYTVGEHKADPESVLALLTVDGVTNAMYQDVDGKEFLVPAEQVHTEAWPYVSDDPEARNQDVEEWGFLVFVQDEVFRTLCVDNDIDPAEYFDPEHPMALAWNQNRAMIETDMGIKRVDYRLLDNTKLPCTVTTGEFREMDGYAFGGVGEDETGARIAIYYPIGETTGEPDWDAPVFFPPEEAEVRTGYTIGGIMEKQSFGLVANQFTLFYPFSMEEAVLGQGRTIYQTNFEFQAAEHAKVFDSMKAVLLDAGMDATRLHDAAADEESTRMMVKVVNVFAYGFIILISLIAVANVFNTISTNILLRRREFAMLRSIGLGGKGFRKMMNYECIIYGLKGLAWGLPAAFGMTWVIWRITNAAFDRGFYIPWTSIVIAVGSVFLVVFVTMLYATDKLKKDNPIDALKNENL